MLIAQFSDLHYATNTLPEVDRCFGYAIDRAIEADVDAAVISGDATDHALELHAPAVEALARRVQQLAEHCPVLLLQGTYSHEPPGTLNVFCRLAAKHPIFVADPKNSWEQHKVTACQVVRQGDWYLMFYIGFRDVNYAQIGIARSKDGITDWQRHRANPIIRPGKDQWDHDAVYKPYAIYDGKQWLLWYNGRKGGSEQIGLAIHKGEDLGFE